MTTHINKTTGSCYASLKEIRSILLHSHLMCGSFSLYLLSYQRLITAIQLWSVYLLIISSNFSMSSTQLLKSLTTKENMTTSLLFMISIGYAFTREMTTKSLHSFSSLSWVMHRYTCLSLELHIFLVGAGSDEQPEAPSSNHMPDVRHWMAGL